MAMTCRQQPPANNEQPAFTLIELLVVIAVIAVLVAILVPCLGRAREAGRRAACMGHMHQVQLAWHLYAVDHGDHIVNGQPFPAIGSPTKIPNCGGPWLCNSAANGYATAAAAQTAMRTGALAPYIGDVRAYFCPARYRHFVSTAADSHSQQWLSSYAILPSMNVYAPEQWLDYDRDFRARNAVGRTVLYVRKISELVDPGPSARAVFIDMGQGSGLDSGLGGNLLAAGSWHPGDPHNFIWGAPIHHASGTCLSSADGHAEHWRWSEPETIAMARSQANETAVSPAYPKPDGPDFVRLFMAIWGKWPASR
jgi:prepilin-type N-terminal cleavage/methylation domain-containing protein